MKFLLLFLSLNPFKTAFASDDSDLCKFFVHCGSSGHASHGGALPNTSTAGSMNPSNISKASGFGIETLWQAGNTPGISVVTGNGKIGALVHPNLDNSFFGMRTIEIDEVFYERFHNKKQFKNKKLNLAVGITGIDKKTVGLDYGFSLKRNPDVKKLNPGAGATFRLSIFSVGAYIFKDDVKVELENYISPYTGIPYAVTLNSPTYQESYTVKTLTGEVRLLDLVFDLGIIKSKFKFYPTDTTIHLYSVSYTYKNWFLNFGRRNEKSPNAAISSDLLILKPNKTENYFGVQYSLNKHLVLGLQYNHFLLHEGSATVTYFF